MDEINEIASNQDYVFHASNYGQVQDLTKVIADKICATSKKTKYLLFHCISVLYCHARNIFTFVLLRLRGLFPAAPRKECGPCGDYGGCSESCGKEGIKEGTMDCWRVHGVNGLEILYTRHKETCSDTCFISCPIRECGPCGEYGPCSESCGADGTKTGTKDCWLKDGDTGIEIAGSRHPEECNDGCFIICPIRDCGPCGEYGPCSESCGADGTKTGTKDCWLKDGDTGIEIAGSRHPEECNDGCFIICPIRDCGPCGEYGPCSESCGAEGTKMGTKDCWLKDGDTGIEIAGSRHPEDCNDGCFILCPIRDCGPCGEYGPCSESCGAEGTKTGTKDCWLKDGDTAIEIPGSRHPEECNDGCFIRCPIRDCGPCGEYGPCSESCGADGIAETTKDCWLKDGETLVEIPGTRHEEPCTEPCFIPCPTTTTCKVYDSRKYYRTSLFFSLYLSTSVSR